MKKTLVISNSDETPSVKYAVRISSDDELSAQTMKFFKQHIFGYDGIEVIDALNKLQTIGYCTIHGKWTLCLKDTSDSL